jgi:hypothetical protein
MTAGACVLQTVSPQIVVHLSTQSFTFLSPSWRLPLVVILLVLLIGRGKVVVPKAMSLMLIVSVAPVVLDAYGTLTVQRSRHGDPRLAA